MNRLLGPIGFAVILTLACGAPRAPEHTPGQGGDGPTAVAPKRVTLAVMGNVATLRRVTTTGVPPGTDDLHMLVNAGLANMDSQGGLHAQLAESVPSAENGQWRVFPDGRMETTWRIREGAAWHDGTPVTSADFVFTAQVQVDREVPLFRNVALDFVEALDAPDPRTITVRWKSSFIEADALFSDQNVYPLPKHLLERALADDKAGLTDLPYWSGEFVGTGPFKVRDLALGSHLVLEAFDRYVLGRPKIDVVEIRFIPDAHAAVATVLAGAVEGSLGRGLSIEQAAQIREQWRDGKVDLVLTNWVVIFPQFINPSPLVVGDLRFRQALLHATDRQQMADTIQHGLAPVAHSWLSPSTPEAGETDGSVVRYDYDPRKAAQLIEEMRYSRAADGIYRDGAQRLAVEIRSTRTDIHEKSMFAVADYWQRAGVAVESVVIPEQRARDVEYRATFPGFQLQRQGNDLRSLTNLRSAEVPLAENRFIGQNSARYRNVELDGLLDRLFTTIPRPERTRVLSQILRHISEQLNVLPLFYEGNSVAVGSRLLNFSAGLPWNAHEWDVR